MLSRYVLGLSVLTFGLVFAFPSFSQPPMALVFFLFLYASVFELGVNLVFIHLMEDLEQHIGSTHYFLVYVLGAVVGNLGLFLESPVFGVAGGAAGVLAVFGVHVVRNPGQLGFAEFIPMPAFLAGAILLLSGFVFSGNLNMLPLLVGIGLGMTFRDQGEQRAPGPLQHVAIK
ncbi:rhomboid family intramembrane serine protease [Candidatus Micrarchaeota archaeon]|nr:rhomboid family intramembrane serine protease [Candidatus Micrarchaeota archaeon]